MMGELTNCPICDELFVRMSRNVCQNCFKKEEEAYKKVYTYVRNKENRQATVDQVSEGTGVKKDFIIKFLKEKRIRSTLMPNVSYDCERCGTPIQEGTVCVECADAFNKDLSNKDVGKTLAEKQAEQKEVITYFSMNRKK